MPPPENMVVSNIREDRETGELSAVVAPRDGGPGLRVGRMLYACAGWQDFKDAACFLAGREAICDALSKAWTALSGAQTGEGIQRLALLEIEAAYSQATGKRLGAPAPPDAEPLDDIRRGLGLMPKYGHLSEIEVKQFVRQMDEAAGRKYNEAEPIESQAKRLAFKLKEDGVTCLQKLADELESGFVVDRGMGALSEVDRVVGNIPPRSASGKFFLPPKETV